jgi:tetratricopeptide (TPR) repeat protein
MSFQMTAATRISRMRTDRESAFFWALQTLRFAAIVSALLLAVLSLSATAAFAQKPGGRSAAPNPPPPPPTAPTDSFDQNQLRYGKNKASTTPKIAEDDTCFLPPLAGMQSPTVAVAALQIPAKAKKEYAAACAALNDKKYDSAEQHLRKSVQLEPNYAAAWVTLGQMLAARQQTGEARKACSQAMAANPRYLPPYLCLADVAAREQKWDEVLALCGKALELDPTNDAVAYALNAAANLNLHKLPEAEKSALKAVEIDKDNRDPRVHFLLAQIYEAKGDRANEAAQLREYLKFATDPDDAAMVKKYLSGLEKPPAKQH